MAFSLDYIGDYVHKTRINELLFAWENDADFEFSTSGSTGEPKRINFKKDQVIKSIESTVKRLELKLGQEHIFLCLDPNYIAGAMMFLRACYLDCPISIITPSSKLWFNIPVNHSYTFASFVPLQVADKSFDAQKFGKIRNVLIGGTSLNSELKSKVICKGNNVYHTYGMTETLTHIALMDLNHSETYRLLEGYSIKVAAQGTLIIKTPFLSKELLTNDLIDINKFGEFSVNGRLDFIINSGGFKVNPEKVEAKIFEIMLEQKYDVGNFLVFGKPDLTFGERVCLVTEKELSDFAFFNLKVNLKESLHKYEIPIDKMVFKSFLFTNTGKLARREIIKRLIFN